MHNSRIGSVRHRVLLLSGALALAACGSGGSRAAPDGGVDAPASRDGTDGDDGDGTEGSDERDGDGVGDRGADAGGSEIGDASTGDVDTRAGADGDVIRQEAGQDTGGGADAPGSDPDAGGTLVLDFVKPSVPVTYTNASVAVEVSATPAAPQMIEILVDATVFTRLPSPFTGTVNTLGLTEGSHVLGCHVTVAGIDVSCPPRNLIVDRTPPSVTLTLPFDGAYAASDDVIKAAFSEPMARETFDDAAATVLVNGVAVPETTSLSSDGSTATLSISGHPDVAVGRATVQSTVTDLAGNHLTARSWSWRWSNIVGLGPSLALSAGQTTAWSPAITVDADGRPVVAWATEISPTVGTRLFVQRWEGGQWVTLGSFPDLPSVSHRQIEPDVVVDANGRIVVAWTDQDVMTGPFTLRARAWNGTTWETWDDLPPGDRAQLAADDAGNVTLALIVRTSPDPATYFPAVYRRGPSGWQPIGDHAITAGSRISTPGKLAGDDAGNLELVWNEDVGTAQFTAQRRRWSQGAWMTLAPPQPLGNNGLPALMVGMNRAGTTAFAWTEIVTLPPMPSTAGVFMPGWTASRAIEGFSGVSVTDVDVDPAGRAVVTFVRTTPRTMQVERWSGTAWEAVFDAVQVNPAPDAIPTAQLAFDRTGKPYLAVAEHTNGHPQVYVLTLRN